MGQNLARDPTMVFENELPVHKGHKLARMPTAAIELQKQLQEGQNLLGGHNEWLKTTICTFKLHVIESSS